MSTHAERVRRIAQAMDNLKPYQPTPSTNVFTVRDPAPLGKYLAGEGWARRRYAPSQLTYMEDAQARSIIWSPNLAYGNYVVSFRGMSADEIGAVLEGAYGDDTKESRSVGG